jgi:hypothetical protein
VELVGNLAQVTVEAVERALALFTLLYPQNGSGVPPDVHPAGLPSPLTAKSPINVPEAST